MRWFPNTLQWAIIWIAVLVAAHVWLHLRLSDLFPNEYGGWGLPEYLRPALSYHRSQLAFTILALAALLVWQASGWNRKRR